MNAEEAEITAKNIADVWSEMYTDTGSTRDFIAVGDVDIKVIGAENQFIDTNIPMSQIVEQMLAKISIPPALIGVGKNAVLPQQIDRLTAEIINYRRIMTPVIKRIATAFLRLNGSNANISVVWDNINLHECSGSVKSALQI